MITITNLRKVYSNKLALFVDQLTINKHDFVGLIGNNGAGKSTLLSLILDLISATEGYVESMSIKVTATDEWKKYTGSFLNEGFLIPFLTPVEFLEFIGSLHGMNKSDVQVFLNEQKDFYAHETFAGKYIRELSAGNKNKVGILAAIITQPDLLILDEPFSHLDPSSQLWLKRKLQTLTASGMTILISSHDLRHVTEVCSRIVMLEEGLIVKDAAITAESLAELERYFSV